MLLQQLRTLRIFIPAIAITTLAMHGCATDTGALKSKLDPGTAVTISYSHPPMIFYRDASGRAAYARDYVQFGPLEVNRSGTYRYYLWLGVWNTLQDARDDPSSSRFSSIVIYADGEPLSLDIAGWTAAAIGASEPVYLKPIPSATDAYYEVTTDQIRLIAEAQDIRLRSTGPSGKEYEPWDEQKAARAGLQEFLRSSTF